MTYYGATELARSFRTVRANTIKIAEEIPEDQYGFRPPKMPLGTETLVHIALSSRVQEQIHVVERCSTLVGFDFFGLMGKLQAEVLVRAPKRRCSNCCNLRARSTPKFWKAHRRPFG